MTEVVDWGLAAAIATRVVPRGPQLPRGHAVAAVQRMHDSALRALPLVQDLTGMRADASMPVHIVDRPTWIQANVIGMRTAMDPLLQRIDSRTSDSLVRELGSRGTAIEIAAVLAWLATKVLGQVEVFADPGRLMLVAPTIVDVERRLGVPPDEFRLWVALHEQTHRVQFGAVPWLRDHLLGLIAAFIEASDLTLTEMVRAIARAVRAVAGSVADGGASVVEAIQTPEQLAAYQRITAVMSLLEGHADVVMDLVGPEVVPSLAQIRYRFTARREQPSAVDALVRRVVGMDVKLRQYAEGAVFVRSVLDDRGMAGLNAVWTSPAHLPTLAEIRAPGQWLERVAA